jgi:lactate oxidase
MGGIVRDKIDTSITMLGAKLPHPVLVTPMGSNALMHQGTREHHVAL